MIIRNARAEDVEALLPMATEFATSFAVDSDAFRNSFEMSLLVDHSLVLIAEVDSTPVGYLLGYDHVAFFANGRVAGVEEIYVTPEHRGKGLGKALMQESERWARDRGAILVIAATRRADSFYRSIGYEESATYFRKIVDENTEQLSGRES